ncbi:hypothetical protein [Halegenticoccus soli]|uniref:hypothetical protein n=1 Tax=Halegenticoccus soli TaxID=1985678 RepID=UPI000C6D8955|nr:hypothetical protein [Halegenticoccus soli]
MQDQHGTSTKDGQASDLSTIQKTDDEYDLPIELFAGTIILTMGILVLVTPIVTEMPTDSPWNPTAMNVITGGIYLLIGAGFLRRAGFP